MTDPNAEFYDRTNGYPVDKVILTQDQDGRQALMAYVTDAEDDVFPVDFNFNDMRIHTAGMSHITMSGATLSKLTRLNKDADDIKNIMMERMHGSVERPDLSDLITHPRPQDIQGRFVPLGQNQDPILTLDNKVLKAGPVFLSDQIAELPGENIVISAYSPVEALRAKKDLREAGMNILIINDFFTPTAYEKKCELIEQFKAATPGTTALIYVLEMRRSSEKLMHPEDLIALSESSARLEM